MPICVTGWQFLACRIIIVAAAAVVANTIVIQTGCTVRPHNTKRQPRNGLVSHSQAASSPPPTETAAGSAISMSTKSVSGTRPSLQRSQQRYNCYAVPANTDTFSLLAADA